jgi:acyl-CoA reductase-like NAD-dependent aldehyde dehydrogenase
MLRTIHKQMNISNFSTIPTYVLDNWIGGERCPPRKEQYIKNVNPYNREIINFVPRSSIDDVSQAIISAQNVSEEWNTYSPEARAAIMIRIAEEIEKSASELAIAESIDTGKPLNLSTNLDISRSAHNFRFFAEDLLSQKQEIYTQVNEVYEYMKCLLHFTS